MKTSTHDLIGLLLDHCLHTFRHSLRVGEDLYGFGNFLGMKNPEHLFMLGVLHDIGKIEIPFTLLNKTDRLTSQEYSFIQQHTVFGAKIIKNTENLPPDYANIILYHHENEDGSGYFKVPSENIPLLSKIIRIVDSYDTMTHGRIYQKPLDSEQVLAEMNSLGGKHYDIELLQAFNQYLQSKYVRFVLENKYGKW